MVAQLLTLDAAEDKVLASIGDGIVCLVVHVGLLIDCYRHDATCEAIVSPINGTESQLAALLGRSNRCAANELGRF